MGDAHVRVLSSLISVLNVFLWLPRYRLISDRKKIRALPNMVIFRPVSSENRRFIVLFVITPAFELIDLIQANLLRD